MMRASCNGVEALEDAYFLAEQLSRTVEMPEGDAGVSRAISSDRENSTGGPVLFPPFRANLYSDGTCVPDVARKTETLRALVSRHPSEQIFRQNGCRGHFRRHSMPLRATSETRNATHFVHCVRDTYTRDFRHCYPSAIRFFLNGKTFRRLIFLFFPPFVFRLSFI